MAKTRKNPYLGESISTHIAERLIENEFAEDFELERERLQIAHRVKALREKKRITQTQLAEMVGTKQPSIARLEAGNYWPRIDMLERIAWALGAQLDVRFKKRAA